MAQAAKPNTAIGATMSTEPTMATRRRMLFVLASKDTRIFLREPSTNWGVTLEAAQENVLDAVVSAFL